MKSLKRKSKVLLASLLLLLTYSYTSAQENTEDKLIQGTWTFSDSPNTKWQFKADGKCYDYLDDILLDTYTYSIIEEKSENGKTTQSVLKLINTSNPQESYTYNIDKLNSGKLWLEYQVGFRDKFITFKRERGNVNMLTAR
jgi:hypothetical protein